MDDYDVFVANRLSQLRQGPASPVSAPGSHRSHRSVICFYGRSILSPLLSGEQREEMRTLKEHLKKPAALSMSTAAGRVAHVEHILHSVQLRKAPTLQEFFQEKPALSESNAVSNTSSSDRVHGLEANDHLSFSPPPCLGDGTIVPKVPPLTSTTYSDVSLPCPKQSLQYQADCFFNENEESPHSQPIIDPFIDISHQSQSSGYVTYDNAENATSVFGRVESARVSSPFGPVEGAKYSGGFFLCSPSNTTTKMPDIISHPPIDGEKLERSANESSIDHCLIANDMLTDVCSADSPHKQSVICSLPAESGPQDNDSVTCCPPGPAHETLHEMKHLSAQCDTFGQAENVTAGECSVPPMEVGTEPSQASSTDHYPTTTTTTTTDRRQVQGSSREGDPADTLNRDADARPFEEPYRLSLQALLKKSQEYRQQQRTLRNQAKNSRVILERAQERHGDGEQEHCLSDKENEEFPRKDAVRRRTKPKSGCVERHAEVSLDKLCKNAQNLSKVEDLTLKGPSDEFTALHHTPGLDLPASGHKETLDVGQNIKLPENNPPVCSPNSAKESSPEPVVVFAQTPPDISAHSPAHSSPHSNESTAHSLNNSKSGRNYHIIPSPQLCASPVHCKNKGLHKSGEWKGPGRDPNTQVLGETHPTVDGLPEAEAQDGPKKNPENVASPVAHLINGVNSARPLSGSTAHSQHIDQLELNLSSLKLLISELESTITENMKNQMHPENTSLPAGFCNISPSQIQPQQQTCKESVWVGPNDSYNGDRSLYGDGSPAEDSAWQRRQSLDNYRNNEDDTDPELCDFIDLPYIRPHRGGEGVCVNNGCIANAWATERGQKNNAALGGGLSLQLGGVGGGGGGGGGTGTSNRVWGTERAPPAKGIVAVSPREHAGSRIPQPSAKRITSVAQRMLIPDVFRDIPLNASPPVKVLSDAGNQPAKRRPPAALQEGESCCSVSLNQSYDVDRPSGLWRLDGWGSELSLRVPHVADSKHLTPECEGGGGGQVGVSKAKRRLLMHAKKEAEERGRGGDEVSVHPGTYTSTPNASPHAQGGKVAQGDEQQLRQMHAAQWKALQEEQGRQQQQFLQALAERCRLLQRVSSLCPPSVSHAGDTATLSARGGGGGGVGLHGVCYQLPLPAALPQQPVEPSLPERYRPLVAAAVKGFLTRRLLRTGRVEQLRRTAKDTQQFLQAFEQQSPGRGELRSRQDMLLWERVTLQLRSARYELHDVFFRLSAAERMRLIQWDRVRVRDRDRELRPQQTGRPGSAIGKSSLSAATQKSLERKRRDMIQQKATERQRGPGIRSGVKPNLKGQPTQQRRPGQLSTSKPQRVPKTTTSCRR